MSKKRQIMGASKASDKVEHFLASLQDYVSGRTKSGLS
jgi:hypothetical protein